MFVKSWSLHLTTLSLSNLISAVQDETLAAISGSNMGTTLQNLNIINCINVTGYGIGCLKACPQLKGLLCRGLNIERVKRVVVTFAPVVFIDIRHKCTVAMEADGQ